jgi:flagellar FliL protein
MLKNNWIKVIVFTFFFIAIIFAAFIYVNHTYFGEQVTAHTNSEPPIDDILERTAETPEITTNLQNGEYIVVRFKLQADQEKTKDEVVKRMFQIENIILKILASMKPEDLKGPNAYRMLEERLAVEINQILQEGKIVRVYTVKKIID